MKTVLRWVMGLAGLLIAGVAGYYWSLQAQDQPQRLHMTDSSDAPEPTPAVAAAPKPAGPKPILHPIDAAPAAMQASAATAQPAPTLGTSDSDIANAVVDLVGRKEAQSFLAVDGFVRHVVATVDNLPTRHAALRMWPVQPAGGKLQTEERDGGVYVAGANTARYEPFIKFIEGVNAAKAVALYVKLYPQFQQAYQELGYPNRYFNDRLVEVIDHLLETPDINTPLKVALPEVKGPMQPERPWVMYEFEDLSLDERSAGQKILLRMGPQNAKRIKAKLKQVRQLVARSGMKG